MLYLGTIHPSIPTNTNIPPSMSPFSPSTVRHHPPDGVLLDLSSRETPLHRRDHFRTPSMEPCRLMFRFVSFKQNNTLIHSIKMFSSTKIQLNKQGKQPLYNLSKKRSRGGISGSRPLRVLMPLIISLALEPAARGSPPLKRAQWEKTH